MPSSKEQINDILVHLFNDALQLEEDTLLTPESNLSMREIHVIEAVCAAGEDQNTMKYLAESLHITVGSLTVAANTLIRKGYLTREKDSHDRRKMHLIATEKALAVNDKHRAYHDQLTQAVMNTLNQDQLDIFLSGLTTAYDYFRKVQEHNP